MKSIQMVDLIGQYNEIKEEVDQAILDVISSAAFINGPQVKLFAKNLADYLGTSHVTPCANGTDALQIALMALELQPGDEVITTPFTFVATAEVIKLLQLVPVFVDVESDTFNIDANKIEEVITDRTKCIIPVHLFGQIADMERIMQIANKHGIYVVEDNAQAIGADFTFSDGTKTKAGTIGHIGCTSFYPSKNLGAYGDAGAISTNDDELGNKIQIICNHGSKERYHHESIGVNSRMDSFQAAILNIKLNNLDQYIASRQKAAKYYDETLNGVDGIEIPVRAKNSTHVFHQYTLKVADKRDEIKEQMNENGVPSMIYYPIPLHLQEGYQLDSKGVQRYKSGDFPISEQMSNQVLSLPMHTELSDEQLDYICDSIKKCYTVIV